MMTRLKARMLLSKCIGDEIWSAQVCRAEGVPDQWIAELSDCFESGFRSDRETIYHERHVVNQFHGVRDRDLALRLAEFLGVDTSAAISLAVSPRGEVQALKEALDEL